MYNTGSTTLTVYIVSFFLLCYFTNAAGFSDNDDDNGDDDGSHSTISTAASSRVSTAKSRASSARLTSLNRWSGTVGSSKPCSSVSSKKTNAWASISDEKEEKAQPLVPSLFAHVPPTVYFFVEGEKGRSSIFEYNFFFNKTFKKRKKPRFFNSFALIKTLRNI